MNRRPIMRRRKRAVFVIAFVGISATAGLGMAQAADPASPLTIKPLQGVSFDIGTKRAVSYFLIDGNSCKLTLMLAEVVHGDEVNGPTTTRVNGRHRSRQGCAPRYGRGQDAGVQVPG